MTRPQPAPVLPAAAVHDVEVVIEDDRWRAFGDVAGAVNQAIAALLASGTSGTGTLTSATVLLADDAHVASLNMNFRGKSEPTNVLSFPAGPVPAVAGATAPGATGYAGDVIIARETVEREAGTLGVPVLHHLQHLAVHGLLHLIGYDHITDADATVMETLETRILATLGIADPYAL